MFYFESVVMSKTVLITGATKGIGLAISKLLHLNGYDVIGVARNKNIVDFPGEIYTCDLTDINQTDLIIKTIKDRYPNIDYLVNNVGNSIPQILGEIDLNSFNLVYDINVRSTLQITQGLVKQMKINMAGRIINISSIAIFGLKGRSCYSAAKSAIIGLTKTWALELSAYGITVNAISPGFIDTDLLRKSKPIGSAEEKDAIRSVPLARIGRPQEVAALVKFLFSEDAGYITGQNIVIDGGWSL